MREPIAWIRKGIPRLQLNYDASAEGFRLRGWHVERYEDTSQVELLQDDIVHGPTSDVRTFLPDLDVVDYPESLREFLYRDIEQGTIADAMHRNDVKHEVLFIKPRLDHKIFTGKQIWKQSCFTELAHVPKDTEIWISEPVRFLSEWRVYVKDGSILKVCNYKGDPTIFPNPLVIKEMVQRYENPPRAYGLDVGVTGNYMGAITALVEVNLAHCLGNYGISPVPYSVLIQTAWEEQWTS